jgi:nitrite reductase/ring-hydroxylating ferredoxin subunit
VSKIQVCRVDEVAPGASLRVELEGLPPLAVFNLDGDFYIINDTCSHGEASLCEGEIEDGQVECPWHNARFCIKSGKALTFPAVEPQRAYMTEVRDGLVFLVG